MSDFDPVERTAYISTQIREAIRAALPAPPEQFFTVMVPGKVVNYSVGFFVQVSRESRLTIHQDFTAGFDTAGKQITTVLPNVTELNQAVLCDEMPALSAVQLGPTGRSVSRSYAAVLSKLVPAGLSHLRF